GCATAPGCPPTTPSRRPAPPTPAVRGCGRAPVPSGSGTPRSPPTTWPVPPAAAPGYGAAPPPAGRPAPAGSIHGTRAKTHPIRSGPCGESTSTPPHEGCPCQGQSPHGLPPCPATTADWAHEFHTQRDRLPQG